MSWRGRTWGLGLLSAVVVGIWATAEAINGGGSSDGSPALLQTLSKAGHGLVSAVLGVGAPSSSTPMMIPSVGIFPSLDLLPRLSLWLAQTQSTALAGQVEWACGVLAVLAATGIWCTRLVQARVRPSAGVSLCTLFGLGALMLLAFVPVPELAVSFLAGTAALVTLDRQAHRVSLSNLLGMALVLVLAWISDGFFWAALPGFLLALVARTPAPVRQISPLAAAVVAFFPVAAAVVSAAFITWVYLPPRALVALTAEFELLRNALTEGRVALTGVAVLVGATLVPLGILLVRGCQARMRHLWGLAAPLSAALIGAACAGPGGGLVAVPFAVAVAFDATLALVTPLSAKPSPEREKTGRPLQPVASPMDPKQATGQAVLIFPAGTETVPH